LARELVNAGIHFGHRISRWNPKMKAYIFGKRNLIHIIDIRETIKGLLRARKFLAQVVARGDDVLFVGTKRQARHTLIEQATRVGMPYVVKRWLGGTLTNFRTIRSRLGRLEELEAIEADGRLQEYSKKAVAMHQRELQKIRSNLEGIRKMEQIPGALVVVDVRREHLAVREAKKLGIPTVCLIDTDSDPDFADIPIPGNDDSMRSIETVLKYLADAVEEGKRGRVVPAAGGEGGGRRRSRRPASSDIAAAETPRSARSEGEQLAGVEAGRESYSGTGDAADESPSIDREVPAMPES